MDHAVSENNAGPASLTPVRVKILLVFAELVLLGSYPNSAMDSPYSLRYQIIE